MPPGLPGLPPPGFLSQGRPQGLPGLPAPGFLEQRPTPDELIGDGSGGERYGRAVVGGLSQLVPFADRLIAGGATAVDALSAFGQGGYLEKGLGGQYDRRLAEIRDYQDAMSQTYAKSPVVAGFQKVGPALLLPFKSKVPVRATVLGKTITGASESAAMGGLLGVSQGRTPEEMAQKGLEGLESGAKWGAALTFPLAVAGKVVPSFRGVGEASRRKAYGFRSTDAQRTADDLGVWDIVDDSVETPVKAALDDLISNGKLADPARAGRVHAQALRDQAELSKGINDIIQAAEDSGARAVPTFDNAVNYIAEHVPADKVDNYLDELSRFRDSLVREGKGSLLYLQRQKIAAGKEYEIGNAIRNGFYKAKYQDLQKTIESVAPDVIPLNRELSKFKIVQPILNRLLSGDEAKDVAGSMIQRLRTSGGNTVGPIMAGAAIGGGAGGVAGGALGVGVGALATPTGRRLTGDALVGLSESGPAIASGAGKIPKAIAAGLAMLPGVALGQSNPQETKTLQIAPSRLESPRKPKEMPQGLRRQQLPEAGDRVGFSPSSLNSNPIWSTAQQPNIFDINYRPENIFDRGDVEPNDFARLSAAVERVESGGKADAVSPKGALGLMQMMPPAARDVLRARGVDDSKYSDAELKTMLRNPEVNKEMGEAYLKMQLERFGDLDLALAAYNAGPSLVARLLRTGGDTFEDIRSSLPGETQAYVKRVRGFFDKGSIPKNTIKV